MGIDNDRWRSLAAIKDLILWRNYQRLMVISCVLSKTTNYGEVIKKRWKSLAIIEDHRRWGDYDKQGKSPAALKIAVRPFVRDAIFGDPRIRFFSNLTLSCILARLKECPKRIFEKKFSFTPHKSPICYFLVSWNHLERTITRWFIHNHPHSQVVE